MVEGVGDIPRFLFCLFHKYFTRYMLQACYVDENHHFLYIISQTSCENLMFLRFFSEKSIFAHFHVYFNTSKFARAR